MMILNIEIATQIQLPIGYSLLKILLFKNLRNKQKLTG